MKRNWQKLLVASKNVQACDTWPPGLTQPLNSVSTPFQPTLLVSILICSYVVTNNYQTTSTSMKKPEPQRFIKPPKSGLFQQKITSTRTNYSHFPAVHFDDAHTAGFTHASPFGSEWSAIHLDGVTAKRQASLCLASHTVVALSLLQASPILARAACENKDIEPIIAIVTKILLNIFFPLCWVVWIINSKFKYHCRSVYRKKINALVHRDSMYR